MGEFSPLEVVRAGAWTRATFTTYSLSLGFFEAVVLEALMRQKSAQPLILADLAGMRSALAEHGARRVGRDYDLEPVKVDGGVFHPKVCALESVDDAHLILGSGNLTFGGWGSNLECIEHLHPSFAGDAFQDAADFFRAVATDRRLTHEAAARLEASAAGLERAGLAGCQGGSIRIVHSLAGEIGAQIVAMARELGAPQRVTAASPFWDGGEALGAICHGLGLDHAFVHAHPGRVVEGAFGADWPRRPSWSIAPVNIDWLCAPERKGPLHAKLFEIVCARGRIVVSGSANATTAGLGAGRNVEACVVRVAREPQVGWSLTPCDPPTLKAALAGDDDAAEPELGVLRAALLAGRVSGLVMTGFPAGPAPAVLMTSEGRMPLGEAIVSADGRFEFRSETLEREAWTAGRLVLRLEAGARAAEGFVAFTDLQEVRRQAGPLAARLLAVLGHTDTPADAAAIMAWFYEHPEHLTKSGGGWGGGGGPRADDVVPVALLLAASGDPMILAPGQGADGKGWRRFMEAVFAALSAPRPPFETHDVGGIDDDDDDGLGRLQADPRAEADAARRAAAIAKARSVFELVFEKMMARRGPDLHVAGLFALTQYICDLTAVDEARVREYLADLVEAFVQDPDPETLEIAAAAVMVAAMAEPADLPAARRARRRLLALGWPLQGAAPEINRASGFQRRLSVSSDTTPVWEAILSVTTPQEEARAYRTAFDLRKLPDGVPLLKASKVWTELAASIDLEPRRRAVRFVRRGAQTCTCQSSRLPVGVLRELDHSWVAKAPCGHVLMCEEA